MVMLMLLYTLIALQKLNDCRNCMLQSSGRQSSPAWLQLVAAWHSITCPGHFAASSQASQASQALTWLQLVATYCTMTWKSHTQPKLQPGGSWRPLDAVGPAPAVLHSPARQPRP